MPQLEMRVISKMLWALIAFAFVVFNVQSVMAQQWPVGQVPVENAVPQYRPSSVPSISPSNKPATLPLDFFNESSSPVQQPVVQQPVLQQPVLQQPVLQQPVLQQPVLQQPSALSPKLLKPEMSQPKVTTPKIKPAAKKTTKTVADTKKKAAKKEVAKDKAKSKKKAKPKKQPVLNNEIYRDQSLYPIDPRKPNWPCAGGSCRQGCQCQSCLALGNQGKPHRDRQLGGCKCDSCKPTKHPNFSVHWPRPFSAKIDARNPEAANARYAACQPKRLVDVFDGLSTFKLIDYKRTDNGYCGPGSDPYGCVGESKLR